jgi:hypothetical protein
MARTVPHSVGWYLLMILEILFSCQLRRRECVASTHNSQGKEQKTMATFRKTQSQPFHCTHKRTATQTNANKAQVWPSHQHTYTNKTKSSGACTEANNNMEARSWKREIKIGEPAPVFFYT